MRPFIVGVGGGHSGAGKTRFVCGLLGLLKGRGEGWGAVKFTRTHMFTSISTDPEIVSAEGKDTGRMLEAGASEVLWVQAAPADVSETAEMAVERLSGLPGLVVEGNAAIEVLNPDIVIFIIGDAARLKESAHGVLRMAHVVYGDYVGPRPAGARAFNEREFDECLRYVTGLIDEGRT